MDSSIMIITTIGTIAFFINTVSASHFLPFELFGEVLKHLNLKEMYKGGVPICTKTYRAFQPDLRQVNRMDYIITDIIQSNSSNVTDLQLAEIATLQEQLQFSPLFAYRRDLCILSTLRHHFKHPLTKLSGFTADANMRRIFNAFNVHAITYNEYIKLSFPQHSNHTAYKARLLILSSRTGGATPIWTAALNESDGTHYQLTRTVYGSLVQIRKQLIHFPWFTAEVFPDYYLSFVYEHCWSAVAHDLRIPDAVDAVFDPQLHDKSQMHNLAMMVKEYKLRILHREYLTNLRTTVLDVFVITGIDGAVSLIVEADLVNYYMLDHEDYARDFALRNELMTGFVLHLWDQMRNHPDFGKYGYILSQRTEEYINETRNIMDQLTTYNLKLGDKKVADELAKVWDELQQCLEKQRIHVIRT
eukprot:272650_1